MARPFRVVSPCAESWESMSGDARARFCTRCKLSVHDLSWLSDAEVQAMLGAGRVCGRMAVARPRSRVLAAVILPVALVVAIAGLRVTAELSPQDFPARLEAAKGSVIESLRGTRTFGPLIDRLAPRPRPLMGVIRGSGK